MKIAICFSGSIRDFPTCLPSLKKYFLNNLNADIFLHLWKMDNASQMGTNVNFKWRNDDCEETYVIEQLQPVLYAIDKYSNEWENKIITESKINLSQLTDAKLKNYGINACGMYYKISKCFDLVKQYSIEKNITYDLVIRARLDFIWEDYISLNDFNDIDNNKIYLIKDRYAAHSKLITNDKFFAGSYEVMEKMCNIFNCIHHYQNIGLMVEGQTLNENHIRSLKLNVKWIGHKYTYYKCLGRHRIKNNNKYILVENNLSNDKFLYELSYYLLYRDYNIIYLDQPKISDKDLSVLKSFVNFHITNADSSSYKMDCYIGSNYRNDIDGPQIILGKNIYGEKCTSIKISDNIYFEELIDFIYSIIVTKKYGGTYDFVKTKVINIPVKEKVIFKYLDHGYYETEVFNYNYKKKRFTVKADNEKIETTQECIKAIDILKYYDENDPNTMPTNLYIRKKLF